MLMLCFSSAKEQMRQNDRDLNKVTRDLDKERAANDREQKKLVSVLALDDYFLKICTIYDIFCVIALHLGNGNQEGCEGKQ